MTAHQGNEWTTLTPAYKRDLLMAEEGGGGNKMVKDGIRGFTPVACSRLVGLEKSISQKPTYARADWVSFAQHIDTPL